MKWLFAALKNYADFNGRARRKEYWMFVLFTVLACMVTVFLDTVTRLPIFSALVMLALVIPSFAVTVRRLHDTNRSGWYFLLSFIPIAGPIVLFVFNVSDSHPGTNAYGPNPKGIENKEAEIVS
ncbi:DUF805 domain-containing protein [Vibrio profundum]|uniref:DUF805 domain-containing protein n=1 Tax=Vibrio profundum TaxID=2910247 RepID=UPI003D14A382